MATFQSQLRQRLRRGKKYDEKKVEETLKELKIEGIKPTKVIRVGHKGRFPRKALAIFSTVDDCKRVLRSAEGTKLSNDIFLTRDRTYNQRQEARLYCFERKKEDKCYNLEIY